jgi:hypothetical protein
MNRRSLIAFTLSLVPFAVAGPRADEGPASGSVRPNDAVEHVPAGQAVAILGGKVQDADGKMSGMLVDVLVDEGGRPKAAVIDFGGFLGIGERRVAVAWPALSFTPGDHGSPITVALSPDQIRKAPTYGNPAKPVPVVVPAAATSLGDEQHATSE